MKKLFVFTLVFILAVSCFVGCTSAKTETEPPTTEGTVLPAGDELLISARSITSDEGVYYEAAAEKDGEVVWTYTTPVCSSEVDGALMYFGHSDTTLFFNVQHQLALEGQMYNGCIIAVDILTGKEKWESVDFSGIKAAAYFDKNDNLYICGDTNECVAINNLGMTMWRHDFNSDGYSGITEIVEKDENTLEFIFAECPEGASNSVLIDMDGIQK